MTGTEIWEEVSFRGHALVRADHPTTLEITKDAHLTARGDCIVGVAADKGLADLSPKLKAALKSRGTEVSFRLVTPGGEYVLSARGSPLLSFESANEMVIRRSEYTCGRTLAVKADASARDIPRVIVDSLKSQEARGILRIEVSG